MEIISFVGFSYYNNKSIWNNSKVETKRSKTFEFKFYYLFKIIHLKKFKNKYLYDAYADV